MVFFILKIRKTSYRSKNDDLFLMTRDFQPLSPKEGIEDKRFGHIYFRSNSLSVVIILY